MALMGTVIAVTFVLLAVRHAGARGRILLAALLLVTFAIPFLFPTPAGGAVGLASRMALGIGCLLYLKVERLL